MPLYVRAAPEKKNEKNIYGPYPENKLQDIVTFARISSQKARFRPRREVYWVCGTGAPILVRVYESGRRIYPPESRGDGAREQYRFIRECLSRARGKCDVRPGTPSLSTRDFLKARRLKKKFVCPFAR
jgi:hypothetical protein